MHRVNQFVRGVFVLATAAALLAGCSINPSTGRSQLILVSPDQVSAMGESAMPELIASYGGRVPSPVVTDYVTSVGRDLADKTESTFPRLDWEFTVLDSDVVNAFALPGGKVFISKALLVEMTNEAQLAGVLGHEIGHVTARHVDERISQAAGIELGLQIIGTATESQLAEVGASLFGQGYLLKFGRDQELEADRQGVKYMVRAGYDPLALLQVMSILKAAAGSARTAELFSTHPDPDRRIDQIRGLLEGEYAATQRNPAYRMGEQRFQQVVPGNLVLGEVGETGHASSGWCSVCAERTLAAVR